MATKKYTPEFNKEIRSIVKNFNKKVDRLSQKYPKSKRIPEKVTVRGLKSTYSKKSDMERRLKQLQSFNEEKLNKLVSVSSDNAKVSQFEYESFRLQRRVAKEKIQHLLKLNQQRDKKEGRIIPSHRTRSLKANLRTIEQTDKSRFSFKSFMSSKRMTDRYAERKAKTDQQFFENFFDMLWANQAYNELDPDLVQQAHDLLEQLSPEQLLEMYNSEPDISRLVEDYNLFTDTQGYSLTDTEVIRARVRFESLMDELPDLVKKYKKM